MVRGGVRRDRSAYRDLLDLTFDADDGRRLSGFLVFSRADGDVSAAEGHVEFGLVYRGVVPGLDADRLGILRSRADLTEAVGAGFAADETAVEWFYKLQLTPTMSLTPDLQFIRPPMGRRSEGDALICSIRFVVTF